MSEATASQFHDLRVQVAEINGELKAAREKIEKLEERLARYDQETRSGIASLRHDLGHRPPDWDTAFSNLRSLKQKLEGFKSRVTWWGTSVLTLLFTIIGGVAVAYFTGSL